ncbi:hypothetical protein [Phytohabitans houttuyneae]|uniref:hypothetical protein n=1 Tax=Phytohabitans houttuyneae TaxID=1076126 RepID=UPI001567A625|nr:hypothetical protein [Phytohabitans houttuyneae]
MGSRTAFAMVGWLVAAAAATVVGLGAVRVIGEGISGTAAATLTQEEVAEALASPVPSASLSPSRSASTRPSRTAPPATVLRPAGSTITAHCEGGLVKIDSVAPPQGYATVDYDRELTDEAEVRFDRGGKGQGSGRVEVHVTCAGGRPQATLDDD